MKLEFIKVLDAKPGGDIRLVYGDGDDIGTAFVSVDDAKKLRRDLGEGIKVAGGEG